MRTTVPSDVAEVIRDMFLEGRDDEAIHFLLIELGVCPLVLTGQRANASPHMIAHNVFNRSYVLEGTSEQLQGEQGSVTFMMSGCNVTATRRDAFVILVDRDARLHITLKNLNISDKDDL